MKTYIVHPPRKLQGEGYTGPITISRYAKLRKLRDQLKREGLTLPMPSGN